MRKFVFGFLMIAVFAFSIAAQLAENLTGTVKDTNGAIVVGAQITIRGTITRSVITDVGGRYSFGELPLGDYVMTITAGGFADQSLKIKVTSNSNTVDTVLDIGSIKAAVTAEIGQEIDKKEIPQAINIIGNRQLQQ